MVRCTWSASFLRCSRSPTATTYLPTQFGIKIVTATYYSSDCKNSLQAVINRTRQAVVSANVQCIIPYNLMHISSSSPELLTCFISHDLKIQDDGSRHLVLSGWEFDHSGVLIVWNLCSVPNLVQISVIVTEIDALMLKTFIWWRHGN